MELPPTPQIDRFSPPGSQLMVHQSRFLQSVQEGHRTFLLADEPGLGKTAQSVMAASIAGTYPMLAVVPNVVKINWAREVERWTPQRRVTVIHGDGNDVDAFADVFVVNYEILDRHFGWLSSFGFRSMVVDEAHFIKNLQSQRSQQVLALGDRLRATTPGGNPLLMALTGTPLINDVKDFDAIWRFLGWITATSRRRDARRLDETGLTPADHGFYPEARRAVIDMGIVRRRKVDVAKRPAREAHRRHHRRARRRPRPLGPRGRARARRPPRPALSAPSLERQEPAHRRRESSDDEPDTALMRAVAAAELESRPRGARAPRTSSRSCAASARPSPRSRPTTPRSCRTRSARSSSSPSTSTSWTRPSGCSRRPACGPCRSAASRRPSSGRTAIDAFQKDPEVAVAVCSLTAAGVGLNLHAASNVVLAELSWTAAEQQQAIDRVHRIGQDEPVTAWRILAAGTIDSKIAELIDAKQGLAARALDGSDEEITSGDTLQADALVALLRDALVEPGVG